jgi:hypothetical protein
MMDGIGGMMTGMWLWSLAGVLLVILLVILIVKALR